MRSKGVLFICIVVLFLQFACVVYAESANGYMTPDEFTSVYNRYADYFSNLQFAKDRDRSFPDVKIYQRNRRTGDMSNISYTILPESIVMDFVEYKEVRKGKILLIGLTYDLHDVTSTDRVNQKGDALGAIIAIACVTLGVPASSLDSLSTKLNHVLGGSFKDLKHPYMEKIYNPLVHRNLILRQEYNAKSGCFNFMIYYE